MDPKVLSLLEYDKIKQLLADYTQSGLGREVVARLEPMVSRQAIEAALLETGEARAILDRGGQVPMSGLADIREDLGRAEKGSVLSPHDLVRVADSLRGCRELKQYMAAKRTVAPNLSRYAEAITIYRDLEDEIYRSIEGVRVANAASPQLARVRKEIQVVEDRIQAKLQSFLGSPAYREALQDSFVSLKGGRYTLPVKASHRRKIDGLVLETSGSGMTVYVEPAAVRRLVNDLSELRSAEEAEEYQVLVTLSGLAAAEAHPITVNLEVMAAYDFALAKGRLSRSMNGRPATLNEAGFMQVIEARHPLIADEAVPLDLVLGRRYRSLVITGPNTGGKTVTLKTIGLLTLMLQSGLHIPVAEGTQMAVFSKVLADIGDGQSIEQSLSTFSSHMGRIASIIHEAGPSSLVLLDEIGTGTDPAEGSALATAILEELYEAQAVTVATTHFSEVKRLADEKPGFINGRMDFDPETLRPRYRLIIGEAGNSHAFWIAERLGLRGSVIDRAREYVRARGDGPAVGLAKAPREPDKAVAAESAAVVGEVMAPSPPAQRPERPWQLGDSVIINPLGQQGVVAELPNAKGEMVIFTRGKRVTVSHKRVTLLVGAEHLYPEGYDLNVALYTWHDRKLMKDMGRKPVEGYRVIREGPE
ncbi:MAG TPA: hypothetical protein VGL40_04510 [Bacillota bacterium]